MRYPKGHEFEYRQLRPSQIRVDSLYQRRLDMARVDKIVREFDGDTFNEPKISYRDGVYWVFDGQHSIAAWRKLNGGEDKLITCKIFKGMTWLDECYAFMRQNGISKDPSINEKLRAAKEAKDPEVMDMVNRANFCGFVVDFSLSKTPTRIVATAALARAYKKLGPEQFSDMLMAIKEAWYGDMDAVSTQIITGMAKVYKDNYGCFKRDELVKSLKRVTPAFIIRNGKSYTDASNGYAKEIIKIYNKGRRNRLDDAKV